MNILKETVLNQLIRIPAVKTRAKKYHRTGLSHNPESINSVYEALTAYAPVLGKRILEIGPGMTLEIITKAKEDGASVLATVDIENYLDETTINDFGIDCRLYDGQRMPFQPESFDIIWSNDVFEHIRFPRTTVEETFRVLRNGGIVVHIIDLQDHFSYGKDEPEAVFNCLKYPSWVWKMMTWNRSNYVNRLRASDWTELHKAVGFEIVDQTVNSDEFIRQHYRINPKLSYLQKYSEDDAVSTSLLLTARKKYPE